VKERERERTGVKEREGENTLASVGGSSVKVSFVYTTVPAARITTSKINSKKL